LRPGDARELAGGEGVARILGTGAAVNDLWPDPTEPAR
jgi:hypothetical protein